MSCACVTPDILSDKWQAVGHFQFYFSEICHGYLCVIAYILFYIHGPVILHCFELCKCQEITPIQNCRKGPF